MSMLRPNQMLRIRVIRESYASDPAYKRPYSNGGLLSVANRELLERRIDWMAARVEMELPLSGYRDDQDD